MKIANRVLAHAILYRKNIYINTILEVYEDNTVSLTPFEHETPETKFISGIVAICNRELTQNDYQTIMNIAKSLEGITAKSESINTYLIENHLDTLSNDIPHICIIPLNVFCKG